jgi:cation:H+ antiporter
MLASLLPQAWFAELNQFTLLLIVAVGIVAVVKGADWLVEGAAGLAYKLGMAKVVIGATIVSLGTTSPEAAVSVLAAWEGDAGLALGNGVGSIIADTGLIFGVGCLLCALPADKFVLTRQGWVQFAAGVVLAALCYYDFFMHGDDAALGRWVGIFFLVMLAAYLAISVRWSRAHARLTPSAAADEPAVRDETESSIREDLRGWQLVAIGVTGLAVVLLGGEALVQSAGRLAVEWGVPSQVVAATLIAFGTSLPELMVAITSIRKGHPELLVGNVVGADILNVLFVIGAAAVAAPLQVVENGDRIFLYLHLPTLLLILVLFRLYIFKAIRGNGFSRWMGLPLVAMYIGYVILQYVVSAGGSSFAEIP